MENEDLLNYIKTQIQQGVSNESITSNLLKNGWQQQQILTAFSQINPPSNEIDPANITKTSSEDLPLEPSIDYQLKSAWKHFKSKALILSTIAILPAVLNVLIGNILNSYVLPFNSSEISPALLITLTTPDGFAKVLISVLICVLISLLITSLAQVSLLMAISTDTNIINSFKNGFKKILSYWWLTLLSGFLIFGGFLLFIVPGIIFTIWFTFIYFILINENVKGFAAISRSKEYVKGYWYSVVARDILGFLIGVLASIPLMLIPFLLMAIIKNESGLIVSSLITNAINAILSAYLLCFLFEVYKGLKLVKPQLSPFSNKKGLLIIAILGYVLIIPAVFLMIFAIGFITSNVAKALPSPFLNQSQNTRVNQPSNINIDYDSPNLYPTPMSKADSKYPIYPTSFPK